jgi:hypothetical protein
LIDDDKLLIPHATSREPPANTARMSCYRAHPEQGVKLIRVLFIAAAAVLSVSNAAHAKNNGVNCHIKALDLAKMVGHAHGLAHASLMVWQKTGDKALAQSLEDAAMTKQAEADRETVNYLAAGCK